MNFVTVNIHMPKDRVSMTHQGYGFVEFIGEDDADYAMKIMNMIKLFGKPIRVNKASAHQKNLDVGANIFVGSIDPEVDEKLLYDTFSAFGVILQTPKVSFLSRICMGLNRKCNVLTFILIFYIQIMRDPETGNSKGYAFINFANFEASDAAIEAMNGQYLCNRAITVTYAFKKDAKGERHGSAAERLLAAQNPLSHVDKPHQLFADAPPMGIMPMSQNPNSGSVNMLGMMSHSMQPVGVPPPPPVLPPPSSYGAMMSNAPSGQPPLPPGLPPPLSVSQMASLAGMSGRPNLPAFNMMPPPPPPSAWGMPPPPPPNSMMSINSTETNNMFLPPPPPPQ